MIRASQPLNKSAVKAADDEFYAKHPEFVKNGKRVPLSPNDPSQANLRKEWMDSYAANGGKVEEKKENTKKPAETKTKCPASQKGGANSTKTTWIELEYLFPNGQGIAGASYTVYTLDGVELKKGTLDNNGFAHVDGIPIQYAEVKFSFNDDPIEFKIAENKKPVPNPASDYLAVAINPMNAIGIWAWGVIKEDFSKDPWNWIWGVIQGDFNKDPLVSQIVARAVITLIPGVDQVGDVEDIVANLYRLIFDGEYDDAWVWVALVLAIIGCVPEVGSAVKGVAKAVIKEGKAMTKLRLYKIVNAFGMGNAAKWLKLLSKKLPEIGTEVAKKIKGILDDILDSLEKGKKYVTDSMGKDINVLMATIRKVRERVDKYVKAIFDDFKKKLDEIMSSGQRAESKGVVNKKNTVKQEVEEPEGGNKVVSHSRKTNPLKLPKKIGVLEEGAVTGQITKPYFAPPKAPAGWPELQDNAFTFANVPKAQTMKNKKIRRIVGEGNVEGGEFWILADDMPSTEAEWRSGWAVKNDWNGDGSYVEYEIGSEGLNVWTGPAAEQEASVAGMILKGGKEQIFISKNTANKLKYSKPQRTPWNPEFTE